MKNRFYLRSPHGNTGSNMVFHAIDGKGYTSDLDLAHVYTLEEAQAKYNHARDGEHPVSADHVDALGMWKVDHQYLPYTSVFKEWCNSYVAYEKGLYDGNDVFWLGSGGKSTDLWVSDIITENEARQIDQSEYVVLPYEMAAEKARRTFNASLLNPRTMITGVGLRMPEHMKKRSRRVSNPMTRFNCPSCGKINWQHNPYDFDGCKHCDEGMHISFQWGAA